MKSLFLKAIGLLCAVAVLASLCGVLPASAMAGGGKPNGQIHHWGCDMSFYNVNGDNYSLVNFSEMKADGCEYVILRIGYEGSVSRANTMDTAFVKLYNMARAAGMHVGLYFYSLATTYAGAVEDAEWVIDVVEKNNMYFDYPIYYDVEDSNQTSLGSTAMNNLCLGWCETLEAAGYFPGIYGGLTQVMNKLSSDFLSRYDTWIAYVYNNYSGTQYDPKNPTSATANFSKNYGMWQYKWYNTSTTSPSYQGSYWKDSHGYPLDCNVAYKDYPTIMQTYGYNNVVTRHEVTFETNGGSAVAPVMVTEGKTLEAPAAPTRYAFDFDGWYCNPELTDPYDFSSPVKYGFKLYAKWKEAYWGAETNLMPTEAGLQLVDYNGQGAIWPYWNAGTVTFYNGVTTDGNWSWPSAYMSYENSFDSVGDTYLYLRKDGNSLFNVMLTYLDKDGAEHNLYLSDVADLDDTDFAPGYLEEFFNVGSYIRNLGHAPASGNVKFIRATYFIIGEKDSFTTLYECKLTPRFDIPDPYTSVYSKDLEQIGGKGSYTYNNGVLTMNAATAEGYSVKFSPNAAISPADFVNLLMDVNATAPFNVTLEVTVAGGDATMDFRNEFFDVFGLSNAPDALPSGAWNVSMNLRGYYQWNGGIPESSTVKSVTVSLAGQGSLTLNALQAARSSTVTYVQDGQYSSGNNLGNTDVPSTITSSVYNVSDSIIATNSSMLSAAAFLSGIHEADYVKVFSADGTELGATDTVGTGCTLSIMDGTAKVRTYTVAILGDIDGDGEMSTVDGRLIVMSTLGSATLTGAQTIAGDLNGDGEASTVDVRLILRDLIA